MRLGTTMRTAAWLTLATLGACEGHDSAVTSAGFRSTAVMASPADVAERFVTITKDGDESQLESVLTQAAWESLSTGNDFQFSGDRLEEFEIGDTSVTGQEAQAEVLGRADGEEQKLILKMRREHGQWRVYGAAVPMEGGAEFTLNFENVGDLAEGIGEQIGEAFAEEMQRSFQQAFEESQEQQRFEQQAQYEVLRAVSPETFEKAWRADLSADGLPARKVLGWILSGTDLEAETTQPSWETPVTLNLRGVSRVEALEELCRMVGLSPVYPNANPGWEEDEPSKALTFHQGERPYPVTFAGPFLVEVDDVEENAPHATGKVSLAFRSLGLPKPVLAMAAEMGEMVGVGRIENARGDSLTADEGVRYLTSPEVIGGLCTVRINVDLRHLLRDVTQLERIQGFARLELPRAVTEGEWTRFEKNASESFGKWTLTLAQAGSYQQFGVTGEGDHESLQVRFFPRDAAGQFLAIQMSDTSAWSGQAQASLQTETAPAHLGIKLVETETFEFPFELSAVPLHQFEHMPAALEPIQFEGKWPVTVRFRKFVNRDAEFPEVEFGIASHCNKDASLIQATFVYMDQNGRELKTFPHTLNGTMTMEGPEPVVVSGTSITHKTTAFFLPPETRTMRVHLDRVEFPDGTVWENSESP